MKPLKYLFALALAVTASGCNDDLNVNTIYDHPFIYIENEDGARETRLADNVSDEKTYYFYLSSKEIGRKIDVWYEIIVGNGLVEGVDYELSPSTTNPVSFNPGRYVANIRIIWKNHAIDTTKDNTLRIVLKRNSENLPFGFPGPDHYNTEHKITRFSSE